MATSNLAYIYVSASNGDTFTNAFDNDMLIYPAATNQRILIGNQLQGVSTLTIASNLGVNYSNPPHSLSVGGNILLSNFGQTILFTSNNCLGIGVSNPSTTLAVSGGATITGDLTINNAVGIQGLTIYKRSAINANISSTSVQGLSNDAAGLILQTASNNHSIRVITSNVERIRITSNGNVGIGTSSPQQLLHLSSSNAGSATTIMAANASSNNFIGLYSGHSGDTHQAIVYGSNTDLRFGNWTTVTTGWTERMRLSTTGNLSIGTQSASYRLHVAGDIYATNDILAFSDSNYKTDLQLITDALIKLEAISGYTFKRKDMLVEDQKRYTGLLAQEVQTVLPEAVYEQDGKLSIAYGNVMGLAIEAIKELKKENQNLLAQIKIIKEHLHL